MRERPMGNMVTICMWPWAITVIYFSLLTSVCHFSWALVTLLAGFLEEWILLVCSYARWSFIHICLQVQLIIKCLNMKVLQVTTKFCFCFGAICCLSPRYWVCSKRWKKSQEPDAVLHCVHLSSLPLLLRLKCLCLSSSRFMWHWHQVKLSEKRGSAVMWICFLIAIGTSHGDSWEPREAHVVLFNTLIYPQLSSSSNVLLERSVFLDLVGLVCVGIVSLYPHIYIFVSFF